MVAEPGLLMLFFCVCGGGGGICMHITKQWCCFIYMQYKHTYVCFRVLSQFYVAIWLNFKNNLRAYLYAEQKHYCIKGMYKNDTIVIIDVVSNPYFTFKVYVLSVHAFPGNWTHELGVALFEETLVEFGRSWLCKSLSKSIVWKRAAWTFYQTSPFVFYRKIIWGQNNHFIDKVHKSDFYKKFQSHFILSGLIRCTSI